MQEFIDILLGIPLELQQLILAYSLFDLSKTHSRFKRKSSLLVWVKYIDVIKFINSPYKGDIDIEIRFSCPAKLFITFHLKPTVKVKCGLSLGTDTKLSWVKKLTEFSAKNYYIGRAGFRSVSEVELVESIYKILSPKRISFNGDPMKAMKDMTCLRHVSSLNIHSTESDFLLNSSNTLKDLSTVTIALHGGNKWISGLQDPSILEKYELLIAKIKRFRILLGYSYTSSDDERNYNSFGNGHDDKRCCRHGLG
ncbi:unnamed protein product [Ambrosiozyma monospora]|uniref:Unnamed protein product n=1 Tax=Ambrosiozyma monospora TaxID=43982 RepID=A0ACB5U8E7_AMBMO|nr:unnamed protein product [Ambrosiozyma monospora]